MTRISYGNFGDRFYFEASGHALSEELFGGCGCDGTAVRGGEAEDSRAVCAAISILVLCAAERLRELESEGSLAHLSADVESGYACFDVTPREDSAPALEEIFGILMTGFALLEESYPELISCE